MAHKGQSEPPVSLFSFQDIVTGLAGIMFLIVLLLALILCSSHPHSRRQSADPEIRALTEQLERREKELQTLRQRVAALAGGDPEALARRYETLHRTVRDLQDEEPELERRLAALTPLWQQEKVRRERLQDALQRAREEERRLTAVRQQAEQALKTAERQREESRKLLRFQVDSPTGKSVVIGICSKDSVEFRNVAAGNAFTVPLPSGAASPELRAALAQFQPEHHYFCLFFRPESYDYAEALLALLKTCGFERGLEPLPENDSRPEFPFAASAGGTP